MRVVYTPWVSVRLMSSATTGRSSTSSTRAGPRGGQLVACCFVGRRGMVVGSGDDKSIAIPPPLLAPARRGRALDDAPQSSVPSARAAVPSARRAADGGEKTADRHKFFDSA